MCRLVTVGIALVLMLFASATLATESLQAIVTQQRQLASEIGDGSLTLKPRERATIEKAQAEVFSLTQGKASISDLNVAEKTRLENALEQINAAVKGSRVAEEEQEVCWRERKVGSQIMVTRCGKKREIEEAREGARGFMQRPRTCVASETASCGAAP